MDEQIKSKRLCRSLFLRERYAVQLCQKAGRMVAGNVEFFCFVFFLLLEMTDLNKLTPKLEYKYVL